MDVCWPLMRGATCQAALVSHCLEHDVEANASRTWDFVYVEERLARLALRLAQMLAAADEASIRGLGLGMAGKPRRPFGS
jgi:hypothetical protein